MTEEKKEEKKKAKKEEKKDSKDEKIKELTELLQRLQAEFENSMKRMEREKYDFLQFAKKDVITKLLPILDNFELALKNTENKEEFQKGVELIYAELYSMLENEGVRKIEAVGKFDHYKHEALLSEEADKEKGTILEELQKGYLLHDKVIRTAKVKVAK